MARHEQASEDGTVLEAMGRGFIASRAQAVRPTPDGRKQGSRIQHFPRQKTYPNRHLEHIPSFIRIVLDVTGTGLMRNGPAAMLPLLGRFH